MSVCVNWGVVDIFQFWALRKFSFMVVGHVIYIIYL